MSRSEQHNRAANNSSAAGPKPISLTEYIRATQESCRHGQCCRDQAALVLAYQKYLHDPKAPWNKNRRSRRSES